MLELKETPSRIRDLDNRTKSLLNRYLVVDFTRLVAFNISGMFIILYLLDTLKSTQVGILFALSYLILSLIDYPTGVLGDIIGYRKVMLIAYFFHICSFILLLFSDSFIPLLMYSAFAAVASSQESGALESWFDNSYRTLTGDLDPDRQIYNSFQARRSLVSHVLYGVSFIIGGMIAQYISRKTLFGVTLVIILIVFFLAMVLVKDEFTEKTDFSVAKYFQQFFGGFKFLLSHKGIFFFFVGSTVIWAANNSIWVNFLLFPTYENYSGGQDNFTAFLRAIIFASGVFWQLFIVRYISKIKKVKQWVFITTAISNPIFFFMFFAYYTLFPPTVLDLSLVFGLFLVFQLPSMWESLEYILRSRLNLDLVPDNIRNAIYSLLPTLTTLIGIPGALLGGYILNEFGFLSTILLTVIITSIGVFITGIGIAWLPKISNAKPDV
ncbi:MAG: MFS transporter [Candidatus Hodarchaeales archaeon]|jgi:MFS family permease